MNSFKMNGYTWHIKFVNPTSPKLVDRTHELRVATTDPNDGCIYLSQDLEGDFLIRVLVHELGHCAMFSFGLIDQIHNVVYPECWIDAEEWICNFIADFGMIILDTAYTLIGNYEGALVFVPNEIEKMLQGR